MTIADGVEGKAKATNKPKATFIFLFFARQKGPS
jgi:hypothetical protein